MPAEELVAVAPSSAASRRARRACRSRRRRPRRRSRPAASHRRADPLGPVVELGRQRAHVEVPAAALRDRADVQRERAAATTTTSSSRERELVDEEVVEVGAPESSTYSTSSSTAFAAARSSPRARRSSRLRRRRCRPTTIRVSGSRGTSPIFTALAAERYEPNEPPSSTCEMSSGVDAEVVAEDRPAGRDRRLGELQLAHVALREEDSSARLKTFSSPIFAEPSPTSRARSARTCRGSRPRRAPRPRRRAPSRRGPPARRRRSPSAAPRRRRSCTPSIAPSAARMPQRICAASNAGPAGAAVASARADEPSTISELVPTSMKRRTRLSRVSPVASIPATMSGPT